MYLDIHGRSVKMPTTACKDWHVIPYCYHSISSSLCSSNTKFFPYFLHTICSFLVQYLCICCFLWNMFPPDILISELFFQSIFLKISRPQAIPKHSFCVTRQPSHHNHYNITLFYFPCRTHHGETFLFNCYI